MLSTLHGAIKSLQNILKMSRIYNQQLSKISEVSVSMDGDERKLTSLECIDESSQPCIKVSISEDDTDIVSDHFNRRRNLSLCEFSNISTSIAKRLSLPSLIRSYSSRTSLSSTDSSKFNNLSHKWQEIFHKLDSKDGKMDGRIHKKSFQNFLSTQETPSTWSLEIVTGEHCWGIQRQISQADQDGDGYIDKDEYADLVMRIESRAVGREASEHDDDDLEECERLSDDVPDATVINLVTPRHLETAAYAVTIRTCPPPLFLILLSLLQTGVFCYHYYHLTTDHGQSIYWTEPAPLCSSLIFSPQRRGQVWRFITYSLVHSGLGHIILNIIVQLIVGLPLEMSHGCVRVGVVYMLGVVSGSLATSCLEPHVFLAGASGGVYALIAAHLSNLILNWSEEKLIIRMNSWTRTREDNDQGTRASHGGLVRMLKVTAIVAFVVADVSMAVYSHGSNTTTGYTAHLVGALTGLVAGILVLHNQKKEAWEQVLKVVCVVVLTVLMMAGVVWQLSADSIYQSRHSSNYFIHVNKSLSWDSDCNLS